MPKSLNSAYLVFHQKRFFNLFHLLLNFLLVDLIVCWSLKEKESRRVEFSFRLSESSTEQKSSLLYLRTVLSFELCSSLRVLQTNRNIRHPKINLYQWKWHHYGSSEGRAKYDWVIAPEKGYKDSKKRVALRKSRWSEKWWINQSEVFDVVESEVQADKLFSLITKGFRINGVKIHPQLKKVLKSSECTGKLCEATKKCATLQQCW